MKSAALADSAASRTLAASRRVGIGDVGGDAGREQHRVLRDEGDGAAAVGEADVGEVVAVDVDGARLRRVKTGEQRGDGRFAAARLANEGDGFPGADVRLKRSSTGCSG